MKKWMQVFEAAEALKVSERTIHTRIKSGKVETKKEHGKRLVFVEVPDEETEASPEESERTNEVYERLLQEKEARIIDLQEQVNQLSRHTVTLQMELSEQSKRHDTIVMQMTQQLDRTHLQLEDFRNRQKQSWWSRLFSSSGTRESVVSEHHS